MAWCCVFLWFFRSGSTVVVSDRGGGTAWPVLWPTASAPCSAYSFPPHSLPEVVGGCRYCWHFLEVEHMPLDPATSSSHLPPSRKQWRTAPEMRLSITYFVFRLTSTNRSKITVQLTRQKVWNWLSHSARPASTIFFWACNWALRLLRRSKKASRFAVISWYIHNISKSVKILLYS